MHVNKGFAAAAAFPAASVSAGCYSGGATWPSKDDAKCKGFEVCQELVGINRPIASGETFHVCRNGPNSVRYDFYMRNVGSPNIVYSVDC